MPTMGGKQLWADGFFSGGWRIQQHTITGHHRLLDPTLRRHAWGSYSHCHAVFERLNVASGASSLGDHLVVLLHGIFRAAEGWRPMSRALSDAGFTPAALTYPSTRRGIEQHADQVDTVLSRSAGARTVSFVTHSMGGLVAREVLGRTGGWRDRIAVNRLVLIATPNHGSAMADRLVKLKAFREVAGMAGTQLTTDYAATFAQPSCPFGVIAGTKGDGRGYNPLLPGDDDMTVALSSALLTGAEDTLVVPGAVHTFILRHPDVVARTVRYLKCGSFS